MPDIVVPLLDFATGAEASDVRENEGDINDHCYAPTMPIS
jgi:hypothetical protein